MSNTSHLALPYLAAGQAQKHVTLNESLRMLDALVQLSALSRVIAAPPSSPAEGDRYIVAAGATGAWTGHANRIAAWQDGAWMIYPPAEGWLCWIGDEERLLAFDGADWVVAFGALQNLALVGINATADASNRLAVSAAATLLTHDGAGHQLKLNKAGAGDTASLMFQTGYSGRAEIGLAGSDSLSMKVSANGVSWVQALTVTGDGRVGVSGVTAPSVALHVGGPVRVAGYTVSGLPGASASGAGSLAFVSNESGGAVVAFSDGTNWRRVTDRAVVS